MNLNDQLSMIDSDAATHAAFSLLNVLQNMKPAEQISGVSTLYLALAMAFRLDIRDLIAQTERRMQDADHNYNQHLLALVGYIEGELKNVKK